MIDPLVDITAPTVLSAGSPVPLSRHGWGDLPGFRFFGIFGDCRRCFPFSGQMRSLLDLKIPRHFRFEKSGTR